MKKSNIYLLLVALFFAGIALFFGLRANDAQRERGASVRRFSAIQRVESEKFVGLESGVKKLEDENESMKRDLERLTVENASLRRSDEAKGKNLEKMALFSAEAKKVSEKALEENELLKTQVKELERRLDAERKRADGLSAELAELRSDAGIKSFTEKLSASEKRIVELETLVRVKEIDLAQANEEIGLWERRLETAKNDPRIKGLKQELEEAKAEIENLRKANINLRRRMR